MNHVPREVRKTHRMTTIGKSARWGLTIAGMEAHGH